MRRILSTSDTRDRVTRGALVALAVAGLAVPAAAQDSQDPKPAGQQTEDRQKAQKADSQKAKKSDAQAAAKPGSINVGADSIRLVNADTLLGSDVLDRDGNVVGEIEHLLLRSSDASIRFALMDPEGFSAGGRLIAVPWQAVRPSAADDAIQLEVSRAQLETAPRIQDEELGELLEPVLITEMTEYWLPVTPAGPKAANSNQQASGQQDSAQQSETPSEQAQTAQAQADAQSQQSNQQQNQQQQSETPDVAAQGDDAAGHLLVSRSFVTTLHPPTMQTPQRMVGRTVEGPNGKQLGEVEHVVIDPNAGKVAYVLISRGGFLGLGREEVAVPLQELTWEGRNTFQFSGNPELLESFAQLNEEEFPRVVDRDEVAALYRHYGETPYWQLQRAETSTLPKAESGS